MYSTSGSDDSMTMVVLQPIGTRQVLVALGGTNICHRSFRRKRALISNFVDFSGLPANISHPALCGPLNQTRSVQYLVLCSLLSRDHHTSTLLVPVLFLVVESV